MEIQKEIDNYFNDFLIQKKVKYCFCTCELKDQSSAKKNRDQEKEIGSQCLKELTKKLNQDTLACKSSLSHTSGLLVAIAAHGNLTGIGIDVERSDRKVHLNLKSRLNVSETRSIAVLDVLDYWVIKEACYKANPNSKGSVLSQYAINEFHEDKNEGLVQLNEVDFHVKILKTKNWKIAVALSF